MTRPNTETDVWSKIDRRSADECWPCTLRPNTSGYRQMSIRGKMVLAHRIVFMLVHGRWPHPECCHTCDNPACCNPRHLYEGTREQNMRDMVVRGRSNPGPGLAKSRLVSRAGERNPNCKLTDQDVRDIRANYALCRVTQKELAARYGVADSYIGCIIRGEERGAA